jgi:dihydroflavonol-4-reductase
MGRILGIRSLTPIESPRFWPSGPRGITSPRTVVQPSSVRSCPGAVFGPILTAENLGSVKIIQGLLQGRPPATPRLGFWITDVRDLADLHIRAMTSPAAAGERFIAAGEFLWMADIASTLRTQLGTQAEKVPTRRLPDFVVRLLMPFMPNLRALAPLLGRQFSLTSEKAGRILSFSPLPARTTVVDCARSLLAATGVY